MRNFDFSEKFKLVLNSNLEISENVGIDQHGMDGLEHGIHIFVVNFVLFKSKSH